MTIQSTSSATCSKNAAPSPCSKPLKILRTKSAWTAMSVPPSQGTATQQVTTTNARAGSAALRFLELRVVHRLAGLLPTFDAVAHHAHVCVSRCYRPPGGFMRRSSMQVGAVEDELRVFGRRQFFRDVVLVVAGEQMRAGNHAGRRAQAPSVRVIDINVGIRIGHQRGELVDADDR